MDRQNGCRRKGRAEKSEYLAQELSEGFESGGQPPIPGNADWPTRQLQRQSERTGIQGLRLTAATAFHVGRDPESAALPSRGPLQGCARPRKERKRTAAT